MRAYGGQKEREMSWLQEPWKLMISIFKKVEEDQNAERVVGNDSTGLKRDQGMLLMEFTQVC